MALGMGSEQAILANEEFLTMLAHELRNPLAPIMNAIHVIEKSTVNGNQLLKNSTDILSRQVNYIVSVIDDLLDIAKIANGKLQLEKDKVNINSVIKKAVDHSRTIVSSRKHSLEVTLPPKNIWVIGDAARLQQVFSHILNNAAKFTETGGKISLTANYGDNNVIINIRDTGVGIPHDVMPEIFTLFSQPSNHARHMAQGGGMGIGLSLARRLIEMQDGSIEVNSEGIGKGSEFSIILPLEDTSDEFLIEEKVKPNEQASRCLEIMVVDDHIDTAESLSVLLKMWGHMVRVCHSGTAAIQMAKVYSPDIALLDIGLPGCDGYQVAEVIRQECPNITLIAISGYGQKVDKRRSSNAGFRAHLVKPVVPEKLREALTNSQG
jgi:CheY-like chemotaxis protein